MKRWNLRGVFGLLCAVALLGGTATAASAAPVQNRVSSFGYMFVLEDDVWDVTGEDDWDRTYRQLSPEQPKGTWHYSLCPGTEARGELDIVVTQITDRDRRGWVKVVAEARLYEGSGTIPIGVSCFTEDLEGKKSVTFDLGPGESMTKQLRVDNRERRSDDYMSAVFTVRNH